MVELAKVDSIDAQEEPSLNWFAVYVQTKHEKVVASMLKTKGFNICLPLTRTLRKWSDRRKEVEAPVFPGYVFCEFNPERRTPLLQTAGVVRILGAGKDVIPLEPAEITALRTLERTKVPVEPWPFLNKGQWVRIEAGPLTGLTGVVADSKSGFRVVVSVSLLQRSVAVEVNRSQVSPANSPANLVRFAS